MTAAHADVRLLRWCAEDQAAFLRFTGAMSALQARIRETWGSEPGLPVPRPPQPPTDVERARALLAHGRTCRAAAGDDADLFATPERDVLLALFLAADEGHGHDSGSLAMLLDLSPATLARVMASLVERGLVARNADAIALLPAAERLLSACLAAA